MPGALYSHSSVRNGKEMAFFVTLRAKNDVFLLFLCSQWEKMRVLFPLRTRNNCFCAQTLREWRSTSALESPETGDDCATHGILIRVVQLMWLGVGYNWDKVRHRLG